MIAFARNLLLIYLAFTFVPGCYAWESGLFRSLPVSTPGRGMFQITNSSYFSSIQANTVLKTKYAIKDSHILTNLTEAQIGITDNISVTGVFPYYQDWYKQPSDSGKKSGPGDVSLGLRASFNPESEYIKYLSFGSTFVVPEQFGYGDEPLAYRTFSSGDFAFGIDTSAGLRIGFIEGYISGALRTFPGAKNVELAHSTDVFYDSGFGALGIGNPDDKGLATIIMQDQFQITAGAVLPVSKNIAGLIEFSSISFLEKPIRDDILRLAPGVRIGNPERISLSVGMDIGIGGDMPDKTFLLKVGIPPLSPKTIKDRLTGQPSGPKAPRAKSSLVAVSGLTSSDQKFLYEKEMTDYFTKKLSSISFLDVSDNKKVAKAFNQMEMVPRKDTPQQLGIRLGANYIINADIFDYSVKRTSSFNLPLIISFPKSVFSLSARASVTDLVTGKVYDMGVINATVSRPRGINYFPIGESSDISYLTAPETRAMERILINKWVENFNDVITKNIKIFGWDIKENAKAGDEDKG